MESVMVEPPGVDPLLRVNPGTVMANHVRTEAILETAKKMLTSKNAKVATNANFYPLGKLLILP